MTDEFSTTLSFDLLVMLLCFCPTLGLLGLCKSGVSLKSSHEASRIVLSRIRGTDLSINRGLEASFIVKALCRALL